ncbi:MAG TPA: choloylglycine hydrolase family protein [Pirellulaceae bacterium]|nr:choloylglycine hydrolase family protein [Pirellulaceae bacterium]
MKTFIRLVAIGAILTQTIITPATLDACTGITIKPKDGSVVFARTLEFAADLHSNIVILPRGQKYVGTTSSGQPGLRWETKYGVVGANAFGLPQVVDGLNEHGLAVNLFYFPGYAKYQEIPAGGENDAIAPWELGTYLLGTCGTVKEAVAAAKSVRVGNVVQAQMGMVPPVHFVVTDASGASVVVEYVAGELQIHANPLGVMTNAPSFDWHMTNLNNYVNLFTENESARNVDGVELRGFGQGTGMLGLPGDFTPPSRFVRAAAFSKAALPVETSAQGVLQAFHILNNFDIPQGIARTTAHGKIDADYTMWTGASDLTQLRYYFRTHSNSQIRMVDLKKADFNATEMKSISMQGEERIEDVTAQAK